MTPFLLAARVKKGSATGETVNVPAVECEAAPGLCLHYMVPTLWHDAKHPEAYTVPMLRGSAWAVSLRSSGLMVMGDFKTYRIAQVAVAELAALGVDFTLPPAELKALPGLEAQCRAIAKGLGGVVWVPAGM